MLQVSEDGLRITVEQGKSIQATLFMPPGAFKEFFVQDFQSFGWSSGASSSVARPPRS